MSLINKKFKKKESLNDTINSINDEDFLKNTENKTINTISDDFVKNKNDKNSKQNKFDWALKLNIPILVTLTVGLFGLSSFSYVNSEKEKNKNTQIDAYILSIEKSLEKIEKNAITMRTRTTTNPRYLIDSLEEEKKNINQVISLLKNGGVLKKKNQISIEPVSGSALEVLNSLEKSWRETESNINNIVVKKEDIMQSKETINKLTNDTSEIMKKIYDLQKKLETRSVDNMQFASDLSISVYKILNEISFSDIKVLNESERDSLYAALTNIADTIKVIKRIYAKDNTDIIKSLNAFENSFSKHLDKKGLVENIQILNDAAIQSLTLDKNSIESKAKIQLFREAVIENFDEKGILGFQHKTLALIYFLFGALFFTLISLSLYARSIKTLRLANVFKKNQSNEKELFELLNLIQPLDQGDFTKEIVLEDKFLKQVAIAIDTTRKRFGNIVKQMKSSSSNILESAAKTDASSQELIKLSKQQFEKLSESIQVISNITNSIDEVAQIAWFAQDESTKSSLESEKGKKLVDESIEKMIEIRNTIQESSKKIKKLGESAQSISEVTSLIKDITKQINILALNAAIQAASSGESGREFTVVAQEVQRLADDSETATKKIEELINDIQSDTAAAIASMEKTTKEVVIGAQLTEQAGTALNTIHSLSKNTTDEIIKASTKLEEKSSEMVAVTVEMQGLQKISQDAQEAVDITTKQVEALKQISEQLEEAFKQYKV